MTQKVFLNNKITDLHLSYIETTDVGFLYGTGLFETMRSYNGKVFALHDHLDRLFTSAQVLSLPLTVDKDFIVDAVNKTLDANNLKDARIRLTVTPGTITADPEKLRSTVFVNASQLIPYPDDYYTNGVLATLCPFRQNSFDPTAGHKTLSYMPRMIALQQARKKQAVESLWFTAEGKLAEGCISNVFIVKDSTLYTPQLSTPVLSGIVRKYVCSLAVANDMPFEERDISIDDLLAADEVFLTNSIMHVLPVARLEKHGFGDEKPGPVTKQLTDLFEQQVAKQTK